jgi:hypothetical protein
MAIEWADILKISASSSVLTSLATWGLNHFFVHRATLKRDARYLAQRLAIILEKFSVDCANVITDNDTFNSSDGNAGKRHSSLPTLGAFPADADWKAIDAALMDRVMSMPNELALADQAIYFWWDVVGDPDCVQTETDNQAGQRGLKAWMLASELRRRYGIPASKLPTETWDFVDTLRKHNDAAEAMRRKQQAERLAETAEMMKAELLISSPKG